MPLTESKQRDSAWLLGYRPSTRPAYRAFHSAHTCIPPRRRLCTRRPGASVDRHGAREATRTNYGTCRLLRESSRKRAVMGTGRSTSGLQQRLKASHNSTGWSQESLGGPARGRRSPPGSPLGGVQPGFVTLARHHLGPRSPGSKRGHAPISPAIASARVGECDSESLLPAASHAAAEHSQVSVRLCLRHFRVGGRGCFARA